MAHRGELLLVEGGQIHEKKRPLEMQKTARQKGCPAVGEVSIRRKNSTGNFFGARGPEGHFHPLIFNPPFCILRAMFRIMVLVISVAWASLLLVSWGGTAELQSGQTPAAHYQNQGY
ncbi:hypothetical protein DESUT3_34820 [Desulfuromonas versatilis]|uniref:Uncharacterized protein n=1 Tax=Desulfuromonas versatilis TaxID=2802975 RepID=A0ABN6E228_9BACT|nr:hypothetical protein DESUT3_34820 [Desulfuromonas versatilis]